MRLAEIKKLAAEVRHMAGQNKSTGPTSAQGKIRSAINAVKHGLAGKNLLLPGEDVDEYESRMDGVFASFAPQNDAEAQLTALVADDMWKADRLAKIEKGLTLGRIEELLGQTKTAEEAGRLINVIVPLGNALNQWRVEPMPTERNAEFTRRWMVLSDALELVPPFADDVPRDIVERCVTLIGQPFGKPGEKTLSKDLYDQMFEAARQLMAVLMDRAEKIDGQQGELRKAIATIALPDEAELRKVARFRRMIEDSLHRRLVALEQLRKLTAGTVAGTREQAHEYRVRLRLVR